MADILASDLVSRVGPSRQRAGLSVGQASRLLQIGRRTIERIEAGEPGLVVRGDVLDKMADYYGVDPHWLRTGEKRERVVVVGLDRLSPEDRAKLAELLGSLGLEAT